MKPVQLHEFRHQVHVRISHVHQMEGVRRVMRDIGLTKAATADMCLSTASTRVRVRTTVFLINQERTGRQRFEEAYPLCFRAELEPFIGMLRAGTWQLGSWTGRNAHTGEQTASIGYEANTTDMAAPWLRLYYPFTTSQANIDYRVRLQTTSPHFGGRRWWFTCPLSVNGRACDRRVGKLYLPPGGRYFGCRHCFDLTYTSCQESDKRVSFLRRHPEAFIALFAGDVKKLPTSHLLLGLKAMSR